MKTALTQKWGAMICAAAVVAGLCPGLAMATALDDYVAAADQSFAYTLVNTIAGTGYTAYVYDMTSQNWRDPNEISHTEWWHWLTIIVPDTVSHETALLYLDSPLGGVGFNRYGTYELRSNIPTTVDSILAGIATDTQSIVVQCEMVPNQQLKFLSEAAGTWRHEDAVLAYSWKEFFDAYDANSVDNYWPANLPMTKATIRSMDAAQAICSGLNKTLDQFVISGISKRGWSAWLAAAVDALAQEPRVAAIAPMVFDALNLQESFQHHYDVYQSWSWPVQPYVDAGIFDRLGSPEADMLMEIIDPYEYLDRIDIPKYIVNSAGDPFFLPDSSQFYWDELQGPSWIRYVQNTDHDLNVDAFNALEGFYWSILNSATLPTFLTIVDSDGSILVWSWTGYVTSAKLWQANNPTARDFRHEVIGDAYTSTTADYWGYGMFFSEVPYPTEGWTAYFMELTYQSAGPQPTKFSTQVSIVLAGDVDGDLDVDDDDLAIIDANIPTASGAYRDDGDMDGDGDVDGDDRDIAENNYGLGL
ncbi:MAG: PhoPQ-activated pathogenicity [Phycisphaerae bacterium]|nr:PhoPQ-activated pathogenicity [Phycisphaerae bacterium]